ncbi:MAG: hypothetical protein QGH60_10320 [Phycisphaerae bacterium]|jgi:hypothetical protein|nr:hypothetical protein [Phycisphaerae bacterium]
MQITMFVFAKKVRSGAPSLRKQIGEKLDAGDYYDLRVESHKKKGRSSGWMKVKAKECGGALNIEWDADCHMLVVRAVARTKDPYLLLSIFLQYLLENHLKSIQNMSIQML